MRANPIMSVLSKSALVASLLLASAASAQPQQVNLTAAPTTATLPDGSAVPMWGYGCGLVVTGATATCAPLSLAAATGAWSPVVITVPTGQDLQINLTNALSFTPTGSTTANGIPTSLVIVGQVGGGLGDVAQRTTSPSPVHAAQGTAWPIAGDSSGPVFTPPAQGPRVQSFATEVAAGATASLCWGASCPTPTPALKPGTYLIESGTHPSIQGPMGLYGILVVTTAPAGTAAGTAYGTAGTATAVSYNAEVPLLLSEIDPVQNLAVDAAVRTVGFTESATRILSVSGGGCSGGVAACYPPAVNYTPLYYLVNGVGFDRTHPTSSLFATAPATGVTGSVLVRLVNAGLRMHVPSMVGSLTTPPFAPAGATAAPVPGFSLIAEDGNPLPGVSRVQSEVFMAAGKTYDVMVNVPASSAALAVFDRELSLSGNAVTRDAGMLAYVGVNGGVPSVPSAAPAVANNDAYAALVSGKAFAVTDPTKGVIANDVNVFGVTLLTAPASGTVTLNRDGTFQYVPAGTATSDSFSYCANGSVAAGVCSSGLSATVTLGASTITSTIACAGGSFTSNQATSFAAKTPGVLAGCTDTANLALTVSGATATTPVTVALAGPGSGSAIVDVNGGFAATVSAAGTYTFTVPVADSVNGAGSVTSTINFLAGSGLAVTVLDGATKNAATPITDYRWIIEEDRTFYVDPNCTQNPLPASCPRVTPQGNPAVFGTNFHTSHMPLVAAGCTGTLSCESGQKLLGADAVCDVGNGACRTTASQQTATFPSGVHLDPTKRYYISVLPGDSANPFNAGYADQPTCNPAAANFDPTSCGHGMGGAPIAAACTPVPPATTCTGTNAPVTVLTQPSPYPTGRLTVFVFEDDFPLNGEHDAGGGVDVLSPNEPGLGSFQITLFDDAGGTGDATGQPTYDMFNMPLTNSLAGTIDPATGLDACPISPVVTGNALNGPAGDCSVNPNAKGCQKGIIGMIVTCPNYESDGTTLSPLAGQAVVNNLYQGRYGVVATPGADRIGRGEEWLQTNTLDGQKAHDSFIRIGEPAYFQEFGPAGYHVTIGFANPKIINSRKPDVCAAPGVQCTNTVTGHVTTARMSRVPDERLFGSGTRDSFAFTQCYASLGDPDGADFAFAKCDENGNYTFTGIPAGNWKITVFDQWNDQIVDGIMQPVAVAGSGATIDMGEIAVHQWHANIYTRTFLDTNGAPNGVPDRDGAGNDLEGGLALASTNIRFRDGSFSNFNNTDLNGYAGFNEIFPLFSWYVIETTSTRFKTTGVHVVYDAGGAADGTAACDPTNAPCGSSSQYNNLANTYDKFPLPANLSVPGAVYCAEGADCATSKATYAAGGTIQSSTSNHSTGRIDPPFWFGSYGWQGFIGQNSFVEWGKKPFVQGENGGIFGHVVYASTRPFDDPQLLLQLSWEPLIPHVRVNLYREGFAADGVTPTLTLVDHTETSSFDDWAQGFRSDGIPNMNCPGQGNAASDPFFYSLQNQPSYLDWYNSQHGGPAATSLPYSAQYKCYDGMHNWNQLQPAPYDGMYSFPSVTGFDPATGKPTGSNCTGCVANPDATDHYRAGSPMLPAGKYVVEVVVPPGYELVKEEDKNILIGDNFIAPVATQLAGLGNIFILPDQATVAANSYGYNGLPPNANSYNPQNPTTELGALPRHEGDTGSVESFWPCVGAARTVPDFISLYPGSAEVAPFAGATRNLCDRKEVLLTDQASALVKFYLFTSTHVASHYTGQITDDFTSEFDPFSPAFGEKFAPAYLPVSVKDWAGNEVSRTYSDQFGAYNGLNYSTWEVNPPNPTGYGPTMMVVCMNDSGSGTIAPPWDPAAVAAGTTSAIPDPKFQQGYSQFCYHLPFMPGQTGYFDTPVVPVSAFAEGYNHPDCNYPDATPAIASVNGDGVGPWVSQSGARHLTITALGDALSNQQVDNYGYNGPSATANPYDLPKVRRHYGFGAARGSVSIGGVNLNPGQINSWNDQTIVVTVPANIPTCPVQQQFQYGAPPLAPARCGELVITTAAGKRSVDTVTVTLGGKPPTRLAPGQTIQSAIDSARPGDMIIVPPGVYKELVLMWKPVRLQGVGAASSIIDANPHPAGKLDPWRRQVNCLFGLTPDGRPNPTDQSCSSGWSDATGGAPFPTMIVDRIPVEGILGWDATLNGNLAEMLLEPSLMGAYEGAGITVLAKGVSIPAGTSPTDAWGTGAEAAFPAGTVLLNGSTSTATGCGANTTNAHNPHPTNFYCNPSSIDALGVTNSSQGGGGILVHGWAHNLQVGNNRVYGNTGTLAGGITIGQGEHTGLALVGGANLPPGTCESDVPSLLNPANMGLPYCYNTHVSVYNNSVTSNSSIGDELFSATPAGAGGVVLANGADYYQFTNNWVCGNLSSGDGGGVAHVGWSKNGLIEHNAILFNQSSNPTISTNGGGLLVMGAPDPDPTCANNNDKDCVPQPANDIGPSDGTGRGLVVNANLILGNSAESGSGGGLRLQHVNGADVLNFPNGALACTRLFCAWNSVNVTNNIIANNVAGWDGGGVSLQDALMVNLINNTIVSNDSTASAGTLFSSLFAPLAGSPPPARTICGTGGNGSCPQVAGLVSVPNSPVLVANMPTTGLSCPLGHGTGGSCRNYSVPLLYNDVFWQNRSFHISVTSPSGSGTTGQQSLVALLNSFTNTPAATQPSTDATSANGNGVLITGGTGACTPGASYWDIGVRGDTGPTNHASGNTLSPQFSVLTSTAGYAATNSAGNPTVLSQYCNGSRIPPETCAGAPNPTACAQAMGYHVPPGTNETNAVPFPVFSLAPSATVDEGNNWVNMRWGPLSLTNPTVLGADGNYGGGLRLGNYGLAAGSPAINTATPAASLVNGLWPAPSTDYYGNNRPSGAGFDKGAVEFGAGPSIQSPALLVPLASTLPGAAP